MRSTPSREDSRLLSDVVADSDLDTRVPSCPEWSVRDLAHHIGTVQWYWGANVAGGRRGGAFGRRADAGAR